MHRVDETPVVKKIVEGVSELEAHQWEKFFIAALGRRDLKTGCLCNHTDGGEGQSGLRHSEETRQKLREIHTPRLRELAKAQRGTKLSAEHRAKISEAGRHWERQPESIEKTAASHRGRKRSAETCRRISEAVSNPSQETRAKISAARSISVIAVDPITGEDLMLFDSAVQASRFFGVSNATITQCVKGHTQTSAGCGWRYAEGVWKWINEIPLGDRSKKPIVAKDVVTGEPLMLFDSLTQAAQFFGGSVGNISSCATGHIKTSKGCAWEYIG